MDTRLSAWRAQATNLLAFLFLPGCAVTFTLDLSEEASKAPHATSLEQFHKKLADKRALIALHHGYAFPSDTLFFGKRIRVGHDSTNWVNLETNHLRYVPTCHVHTITRERRHTGLGLALGVLGGIGGGVLAGNVHASTCDNVSCGYEAIGTGLLTAVGTFLTSTLVGIKTRSRVQYLVNDHGCPAETAS